MTSIQIWSDIHCPFCWIGKHNFDEALKSLDLSTPAQQQQADVTIEWKSFQLNPNIPINGYPQPFNYMENLAKEKGWSLDQCRQIFASVDAQAKESNCNFVWDTIRPVNSIRAHSLAKYLNTKFSEKFNVNHQIEEDLFNLYFNKGTDFSKIPDVVAGLSQYNLTEEEVNAIYLDKTLQAQIETDIAQARQLAISGVPFFLINNKYAISGAQPPEKFKQTLQQLINKPLNVNTISAEHSSQHPSCKPDGTCD